MTEASQKMQPSLKLLEAVFLAVSVSNTLTTRNMKYMVQLFMGSTIQGGPAKVRPTLLVTFKCVGKIQ